MRKYLLPSALILCLAAAISIAQTINKAVQLSQDATGAFGVDTNNNIYFPGHLLSTGPGTPALTSCGGGTPAIVGSDTAGEVTLGTSATGCVITFNKAYLATPWCVVTSQTAQVTTNIGYTVSTTAITETQQSASGNKINYVCSGSK